MVAIRSLVESSEDTGAVLNMRAAVEAGGQERWDFALWLGNTNLMLCKRGSEWLLRVRTPKLA